MIHDRATVMPQHRKAVSALRIHRD